MTRLNTTSIFIAAHTYVPPPPHGEFGRGDSLLVRFNYSDSHDNNRSLDGVYFHEGLNGMYGPETLLPLLSPTQNLCIRRDPHLTDHLRVFFRTQLMAVLNNPPGLSPTRLTLLDERWDWNEKPLPPHLQAWEVSKMENELILMPTKAEQIVAFDHGLQRLLPERLFLRAVA